MLQFNGMDKIPVYYCWFIRSNKENELDCLAEWTSECERARAFTHRRSWWKYSARWIVRSEPRPIVDRDILRTFPNFRIVDDFSKKKKRTVEIEALFSFSVCSLRFILHLFFFVPLSNFCLHVHFDFFSTNLDLFIWNAIREKYKIKTTHTHTRGSE